MKTVSLTRQYEILNGIRGSAAFVLVLFHVEGLLHVRLVLGGYLAVDLFFILSGFVLSRTYNARGFSRIR